MRVQILGEAEAGKTSLACRLARRACFSKAPEGLSPHPILPVIIEKDFVIPGGPAPGDSKKTEGPSRPESAGTRSRHHPIVERVRGLVRHVTGSPYALSPELTELLLSSRRILVIVDGYSELLEEAQDEIQVVDAEFPVNALIVTSRAGIPAILDTLTLSPLDLARVEPFFRQYIAERCKSEPVEFEEEEIRKNVELLTSTKADKLFVGQVKLHVDAMLTNRRYQLQEMQKAS
jgi:hypothetical protein